MRPDYRVLADTKDITAALKTRLISLTVTDEAGIESDTVEIVLDDENGQIQMPRKGATLEVSIGYVERGLVRQGLYVVDELEPEGWPAKLTIRAKATDMRDEWKAQRTRGWENTTIGVIVATIALAHGVSSACETRLAAIAVPRLDQTNESDMNLLTRLAAQHDAVAAVKGKVLIFAPRGQAKAVSGTPMPHITVQASQDTTWRATFADRDKYQNVVASWYDPATGQRVPEQTGATEPRYTLRNTYPDPTAARNAAEARLKALERGQGTITLDMPGDARLAAECALTLTGFKKGVDGEWRAVRVVHTIGNASFHTHVEGEIPTEVAL